MADREAQILVIGVGNAYRGDDAVGLVVARRLQERLRGRAEVLERTGEGATLMEAWKDADAVILLDAVQAGGESGTVHRLDAQATPLPARFFHYSTHAFSVAEAVELARALGQLPPRLVVYGIEGARFEAGTGLTPSVEGAVPEVIDRVLREIDSLKRCLDC